MADDVKPVSFYAYNEAMRERNEARSEVALLKALLRECEGWIDIDGHAVEGRAFLARFHAALNERDVQTMQGQMVQHEGRAENERLREALKTCSEIGETRVAAVVRAALGE